MAISYFAIEQAIANQIKADSTVSAITTNVVIEEPVLMTGNYAVRIGLKKREEPERLQSISAGKRKRLWLHFEILCLAYALHINDAMTNRDDLLAAVEKAVMKERNTPFGRTDINSFWIAGGEFDSAEQEAGFLVAGEIELIVDVTAVGA